MVCDVVLGGVVLGGMRHTSFTSVLCRPAAVRVPVPRHTPSSAHEVDGATIAEGHLHQGLRTKFVCLCRGIRNAVLAVLTAQRKRRPAPTDAALKFVCLCREKFAARVPVPGSALARVINTPGPASKGATLPVVVAPAGEDGPLAVG